MKRTVVLAIGATLAVMTAADMTGATDNTATLAVAGRANATASIAAENQLVVVAWSASARGATDIYAASSGDGGRTFASPVRVNNVPGNANVSGEQPPRVALVPRRGASPAIVVVWTAKSGAGTRILTARSEDGGRSFGGSRSLPGGDAAGNRGWESAAVNMNGDGLVMWLDHRELAAPAGAAKPMSHDHAAMNMPAHDPVSTGKEQLSKLYVQRLDGSSVPVVLTGGVCYCCKTTIVAGADRTFYAVWRHVYPGNVRDIAFTMSRDGGATFAPPLRVSEDRWMLDGCPENGPAVATTGKDVVVVWPTLVAGSGSTEPTMQLFHSATQDGKSFTRRAPMPTQGVPRHPQVAAMPDGSVIAAWDEGISGRRRVVFASRAASSAAFARRTLLADSASAEYPVVAVSGSTPVIAWTSGAAGQSVIRIKPVAP